MAKYYYLISGLPDINLEDDKLLLSTFEFKQEVYPKLSSKDKKLIDLFYYQFDNRNLIGFLNESTAFEFDKRGFFSKDDFQEFIQAFKNEEPLNSHRFPKYMEDFLISYLRDELPKGILPYDYLSSLYYNYAMDTSNQFISSWYEYNLLLNNLLVVLIGKKHKVDYTRLIVGNSPLVDELRKSYSATFGLDEYDSLDIASLEKLLDDHNFMEREKKLDAMCWNWLEEHSFFHYFSIERLFVYLNQASMIERWQGLNSELGDRKIRDIISSLKSEVKVPVEFRKQ